MLDLFGNHIVCFLLTWLKFRLSEAELLSREETERKRKHEEILTDQGSASEESNDDDLADFDLDNYESEDDPDYEVQFEPVHEKTNNLGFLPGWTQAGLYSHRSKLEA